MLDISFIKKNSELVQRTARLKRVDVDIQEFLKMDEKRRDLQRQKDLINQQRNQAAKNMDKEAGKRLKKELASVEQEINEFEPSFRTLLERIPNIPSDDTPEGPDESANKVLRKVGDIPKLSFSAKEHFEIGKQRDIIDTDRAAKVAGTRFAFLKGNLVLLQFALTQHVLRILTDPDILKNIIKETGLSVPPTVFEPVLPPLFIRPDVFAKMARLEPKEERYFLPADDLYLIGSAEHTLGAMHMDEVFAEADLPRRYVGFSTCFRREAGSYGKDTKGILRVHQFDKLEMESFTTPEQGLAEQNFFVAVQEYIVRSLKLPYQVVAICTGDMGGPDHRQIDIETWLPGQNRYRETHTSDYMTDYQSKRLNIKYKKKSGGQELVHMNDATAVALGRMLIAIIENYQQEDGSIHIPQVLQPYMNGATTL